MKMSAGKERVEMAESDVQGLGRERVLTCREGKSGNDCAWRERAYSRSQNKVPVA